MFDQYTPILFAVGGVIAIILVILLLAKIMYKVADIDKVLIITGGKKPKIVVSGGAFVIPIFRKADTFDLCMLTVPADKDEIMTKTAVPITVDWTAQIRPDRTDMKKLETAIISFKERGGDGIKSDVKLTLMGAVRDIVASMTPEEVLGDKETFRKNVEESVKDEMNRMGLELVSLNIQDITDKNDYFANIASLDAADKQKAADIKAAEVNRITREKRANEQQAAEIAEAEAHRQAEIARMTAEQAEKEKRKETDMKIAQFKIETDTAQADADVAKELQATVRAKEVEERKGAVEITRQEQLNLAAQKERAVLVTRAEAEKETKRVNAEAEANVKAIDADAEIKVAERKADAQRKAAEGNADVEKTKAEARVAVAIKDAEAIKKTAEANAEKTKAEGLAEAQILEAKAKAEAAGIEAKAKAEAAGTEAVLLAQAKGEEALAKARASNEKVNFEIEKIKIENDAKIQIATSTAQIMANIGQNAEFVNIGGGNIPGLTNGTSTGNSLLDTLMAIPGIMKCLNVENQALNDKNVTDEIAGLSNAIFSGIQSAKKEKVDDSESTDISEN